MNRLSFRLALTGLAAGLAFSAFQLPAARAAEEGHSEPPQLSWTFSGPLGSFDRAQLQRGFKVFKEVCSSCHAASLLRFRNLSQPGGPEFSAGQVAALAATYQITDGPNDTGEMFQRPGRAADAFPSPFPNEQAARASNGGAYPPDFSVLAKARTYERGFPRFIFDIFTTYQEQGPDYIHALMVGYEEPPAGTPPLLPTQHWNKYMQNHLIAMPKPLNDGQVEYPKGPNGQPQVPETVDQYARDVATFMVWMAEPHMEQRKRIALWFMPFLVILAFLLYFSKKKIWSRMPDGSAAH